MKGRGREDGTTRRTIIIAIIIDQLACEYTITPDFSTISGFEPKFSGFHKTRSASVPTATCPTK